MNKSGNHNNTIPAVEKTLAILNRLGNSDGPMTRQALSRELGITQSTGYRILQTLLKYNWIRESRGNAYELGNALLPLLLNIGLLALALFGYTTFRHFSSRSTESLPSTAVNNELRILRAINEEIVSLLPLGLLVHDQESNRTVISNKIADHLLPHLNLQNITTMAEQHQGIIQATINNELYEIRMFRSQVAPRTQIFIIRDQDREVLVNKKLKQAQRLYEKNQQGRMTFMKNIGDALKEPAQSLAESAAKLNAPESKQLANQADVLVRLVSGSSEPVVLENGARYLCWTAPFYSVLGVLLATRYALQSLGQKILPLISSGIELVGKIIFMLVFIPRFGYDAVILCEPVIWCFMCAQLLWSYWHDPYIKGSQAKAKKN